MMHASMKTAGDARAGEGRRHGLAGRGRDGVHVYEVERDGAGGSLECVDDAVGGGLGVPRGHDGEDCGALGC